MHTGASISAALRVGAHVAAGARCARWRGKGLRILPPFLLDDVLRDASGGNYDREAFYDLGDAWYLVQGA